ncbi:glycosyltransferase family 4 protein [Marinobacterium sp. AK62]|uniref:Glycosyltransferase family 4 protein n=1 Tax=Marinobacterium alkalitolerans TaxID=1542925 RepID=A0ABS3ZCV0_9GAMM|nr:glycosyltransferase [Marinobacterium alkalitolerans]MBP0049533.1 glycosyltransferase family 4 protein [Marinobacterium alkalitolerans]
MKVLVIGYVWPEPRSSAAGYRMLSLLEAFRQQNWAVTYASPAERSIHRADLPALGIEEASINLNCSSFDQFIQALKPDIVMFDRFMMEEQFGWRVERYCPDALRLLDTEDLSCLRHARHHISKQTQQPCLEVPSDVLFGEHAKREVAAILRSDLTLMISPAEIDLLQNTFRVDSSLLHECPFMMTALPSASTETLPGHDQRKDFCMIGNFRHAPNWDAVLWMHHTIWPLIRKQLPGAQLNVYGAYPPPKANQLHNPAKGFNIKGWAECVDDVMRQSRINLAPLRFGAGLKGKLVDALACGTPSVTTSVGAEGMAGSQAWPQPIAETPEAFAEQAVALYRNQSQWLDAQQEGFRLYSDRFLFAPNAKRLIARLNELRHSLHQHRLQNFTGAMLRHHSMKSTQYMAQWIEAKNRNASRDD